MIAQQMLHNEVIATELKAQIEAQRRELADCMDRNFGLLGEIGDIKELRGESNGMLSKDLQDAKMEKRIEDIKKESDDEAPEHPPRKRK